MKQYAIVINQTEDPTIANLVENLFSSHGRKMSLQTFKEGLVNRLKYNPLHIIEESRLRVPLKRIEELFKGKAYPIISGEVYRSEPTQ